MARLLTVIIASAVLLCGCTTRPDVTVQVDKGAVKVDPPELNVQLPIYVVTEHCDGGFTVVRLNPDAGQ